MKEKLTSRKFWLCAASMLGSIGVSIAGMNESNDSLAVIGMVCAMASAAIYGILETLIDMEKEG